MLAFEQVNLDLAVRSRRTAQRITYQAREDHVTYQRTSTGAEECVHAG